MINKCLTFKTSRFTTQAFTLAEVLITLVVLGVLASTLIPTIKAMIPDKNRVMFKKAYSVIENAVTNMVNDETYYPASELGTDTNGISVMRGFNYTTTSLSYNKFCYLFFDNLNTVSGGVTYCPAATGQTSNWTISNDGIRWQMYVGSFPLNPADYSTTITMDVNGSTSPNCSEDGLSNPTISACVSGTLPDTFQIGIRYDGKLNVPSTDSKAVEYLSNPTVNTR